MCLIYLLVSIYLLGLIQLTIHELGHVFTARKFGWDVTRLRIGVGPNVWTGYFLRTIAFTFNLVPLNGYTGVLIPPDKHTDKKMAWFYVSGLIPELIFMVSSFLLFLKLGICVLCVASGFVGAVTLVSLLISLKDPDSDIRSFVVLLTKKN